MGPRDRNSKGGDPGRLRIGRPSKDLTERVLNEVDFEDRLTGYRLSKRTGVTTIRLSSFEEVVGLLNETHPRLDFDRLEQWIRETMGDPELSGKIRGVIQEDMGDQLRTLVEYIGKALLVDNTRFCKYKQTLFLTRF